MSTHDDADPNTKEIETNALLRYNQSTDNDADSNTKTTEGNALLKDNSQDDDAEQQGKNHALLGDVARLATITQLQHSLAARYFQTRYMWFSLFPQSMLTFVSGVLAFVTGNDDMAPQDDTVRQRMLLAIGCLSLFATFLNSLMSFLKYGTRSEMHSTVARQLEKLDKYIHFRTLEILSESHVTLMVKVFEERYDEALKGCPYDIPLEISKQFERLAAEYIGQIMPIYVDEENASHINPLQAEIMCYNALHAEMFEHICWPWFLRCRRQGAVDNALKTVIPLLKESSKRTSDEERG